jgi:teichuronic acid biosynthesis glycosyltransferase TuaC
MQAAVNGAYELPPSLSSHWKGERVRILTYTSLFPNSERPIQGVFVYQRIVHVSQRMGNEVQVISPVPYFPRWFRWTRWNRSGQIPLEERTADLIVYHPRYPLLPKISMIFHGLLMFLGTLRTALRLHSEKSFDCIDAHFVYPDGFAAVLLGKLLKVPVIVSARGTDINLYPSFKLIRPMIRWTLRHSAGLIAVSASLREVMLELGARPDHLRVIGNGIDLNRFHPVDPKEARRHLGLPEKGQVIASVGSLIPGKGLHFLIPAVAKIASRFDDLRLYILGEGDYRSKLEQLIRECNAEAQIFLVGSVPNEKLRFWFSAANVSCLVSSREGWANVLQDGLWDTRRGYPCGGNAGGRRFTRIRVARETGYPGNRGRPGGCSYQGVEPLGHSESRGRTYVGSRSNRSGRVPVFEHSQCEVHRGRHPLVTSGS